MSDDLLKRAGRALQAVDTNRQRAALNPAQGRELLARAAAVEKQPLVATPPPAPRVEQVKLPGTCSALGDSYIVVAERRGDELRFIAHELPPPGARAAAASMPPPLSGQYRIELNGWRCPLCSSDQVWLCMCAAQTNALHCCGTTRGRHHCACGKCEARNFVNVETVEVRGEAVAATPRAALSGARPAPSNLKRISHDR